MPEVGVDDGHGSCGALRQRAEFPETIQVNWPSLGLMRHFFPLDLAGRKK